MKNCPDTPRAEGKKKKSERLEALQIAAEMLGDGESAAEISDYKELK